MSDFKELVPEFYDTSQKGDFLRNMYGVNFGYKHDGMRVGDVSLPPWAKSTFSSIFSMVFFFYLKGKKKMVK